MFDPFSRARSNGRGDPAWSPAVRRQRGQPLVDLRQVKKAYRMPAGDFYALKGIDLQIQAGEFLAVVGKSGAGKSTLINMITGIDRPTSGEVRVGPCAVHEMSEDQIAVWRGQNVGVVFQSFQLLPMLTCAQNVMLPMDFANRYRSLKERRERALYLLEQVGIPEQADKLPSAVSGGQRQRVAIARALANDPMALAADEPTGNLDSKTADAVFGVFERLVDEGKTILMVTHDRELASRVGRVVQIADGEIVAEAERAVHDDYPPSGGGDPVWLLAQWDRQRLASGGRTDV
jgi:putative ABC transport system ATP-binding protein